MVRDSDAPLCLNLTLVQFLLQWKIPVVCIDQGVVAEHVCLEKNLKSETGICATYTSQGASIEY